MADNRYSDIYWFQGRIYRYDYKDAYLQWLDNSDEEPDKYDIVDEIGFSRENWDNKSVRDEYLAEWAAEIDAEVEDMMPWLAEEFGL